MTVSDVSRDAFQLALLRRVGRGKAVSVERLAGALGRSARTVRAWLGREASPKLPDIWELCRFFGPTFSDEILPPEAKLNQLQAEVAELEREYAAKRAALLRRAPRGLAFMVPPAAEEKGDRPTAEVASSPARRAGG